MSIRQMIQITVIHFQFLLGISKIKHSTVVLDPQEEAEKIQRILPGELLVLLYKSVYETNNEEAAPGSTWACLLTML